jgi:hypothetical protein
MHGAGRTPIHLGNPGQRWAGTARLHPEQARQQLPGEPGDLATTQLPLKGCLTIGTDCVNLKDTPGDADAHSHDRRMSGSCPAAFHTRHT